MSGQDTPLTLDGLRARIASVVDSRATNEHLEGLLAGFSNPEDQKRPIESGLGEAGIIYSWRTEDADIVKAALDLLDGVAGLFNGDVASVGLGVKDLLTFWVRLRRNRARISDPKQVAVLVQLKKHGAGSTSSALWKALRSKPGQQGLSLDDVEDALRHLTQAPTAEGPKALVLADGEIWKCLV
jgi:hypothetical protein